MPTTHLDRMRQAHRVLAERSFRIAPLSRGYADRWLRVDLSALSIEERPVTQEMKDLWVGGKGFDLALTFAEVTGATKWDSPENPICFSSGPLGGTASFPGSGKTLVTAISPTTHSMMDCNVGGYFGPYLKFCGYDALMLTGKAPEESIVVIDAVAGRIAIEAAPLESIDSHVLAEELTEMYADDWLDRRSIAVVSAGRGADHARLGMLNFSFYDWRRNVSRLKQAGRGGVGTVFRDKRLKALVLKNRDITPAWRVAESKANRHYTGGLASDCGRVDRAALEKTVERWSASGANALRMLEEVQARDGYVSRTAVDEISRRTAVPRARLYHMATFYHGLRLAPGQAGEAAGVPPTVEACRFVALQLFGLDAEATLRLRQVAAFAAPGTLAKLEPLWQGAAVATLKREDVVAALAPEGGPAGVAGPTALEELVASLRGGVPKARVAELVSMAAADSCGTCTPCREGLAAAARAVARMVAGSGPEDARLVADVGETMAAASQCRFGKTAGRALVDALAAIGEVN